MNQERDKYKSWCIITVLITAIFLVLIAAMTAVIDPYWHFHGPSAGVSYRLGNGRYMNDGILRHADYEAVIIGTSMTENFKPSQWNQLTGEMTVKTPFFGASFREIHDTLERTFTRRDIQTVIWGMDYNQLTNVWDTYKYESYPDYLSDDSIWNDGDYVWNKTVLFRGVLADIVYTLSGKESADYDAYASWERPCGKNAVLEQYTPGTAMPGQKVVTQEALQTVEENVAKNFEEIIKNHPETRFYLFFTPYSIAYWDLVYHEGNINLQMEATRIFAERLLSYENVRLYCFFDNTNLICNLDNYADAGHYTGEVNDDILQWMWSGAYRWTKDNFEEKLEEMETFYGSFDYESYWNE